MNPHSDSRPGHGHGPGHGHHSADIDWDVMAAHLENGGELQLPVLHRTADRLGELLGPGAEVRRILDIDIGSGPGVMTCVLAEAFAGAETVAVDGAPVLLERTSARAERLGLGGRVTVRHAELPGVPVVEDWPAMLRRAGLTGVGGFTYLLDLPAPLGGTARTFLHAQLTRLRENASDLLTADDLGTLDVLLDPEAEQGILHRPDAFLLSATTVFTGVRAADDERRAR
ncbi:SAM-dependent methyltransferase [Streptomyces sp. NPDC085929]|uniref:SAM-dependent methyltransferase n=1 Tax=Streptomyces sp. NPDC085929 TaxID=3365739 RepID=UPI0037D3CB62